MATTAAKAPEPTPEPAPTSTVPVDTTLTMSPTPTTTAAEPAPAATPTVPAATTTTTDPAPAPPAPGATPTPATAAEPPAAPTPAPTAPPATVEYVNTPEPQNDLTKKFTEAEWTALKEFRKRLPEVVKNAYPEKEATTISLWGVTIDPAAPATDARASVVLMKFLRARHLNPSSAEDMLTATLRWRHSFNIPACLDEKYPEDIFSGLGYIHGTDKQNRPVVYNVYGGNNDLEAAFSDVQRFLRWRVALMERSIALLDFETTDQTVQVHDYEGVSMTSRTPASKAAASEAANIFSSHYPELLARKFFVNVPFYLTWIFWMFKPIISAETLAKMSVVGSGHRTIGKELLPLIDANKLPKQYGGDVDLAA